MKNILSTIKKLGIVVETDIPLATKTVFRIGGPAKYYFQVNSITQIIHLLPLLLDNGIDYLILGSGSNMLIADSGFPGAVIHLNILGKEIISQDKNKVIWKLGAGEVWDQCVADAVANDWWGIENLSYIPGQAGALPIQNVGAYGQQASDVISEVTVYDTQQRKVSQLTPAECSFSYRHSIFNQEAMGRYIVLNITLSLSKHPQPSLDYPDLIKYFAEQHDLEKSLANIRKAIIYIRQQKLPDYKIIGSAGSFFKIVMLPRSDEDKIRDRLSKKFTPHIIERYNEIVSKFASEDMIKLSPGFLLDICNWRGKNCGQAVFYKKHAMVIINRANKATAADVICLAKQARQDVYQRTGIILQPEPMFIGFSDKEINNFYNL
ncbi:MAG: UDP-N-acetylmuramate dehydrogenase [Candidatus Komeilibacteria bacterium]